jgi:hypothetical protein
MNKGKVKPPDYDDFNIAMNAVLSFPCMRSRIKESLKVLLNHLIIQLSDSIENFSSYK